jgi:hypothetical protein
LAGIKQGDHLIEVDGKNVQRRDDADVKAAITSVKYPNPLKLLVASPKTFDYHTKNNIPIVYRGRSTTQSTISSCAYTFVARMFHDLIIDRRYDLSRNEHIHVRYITYCHSNR